MVYDVVCIPTVYDIIMVNRKSDTNLRMHSLS